MSHIHSHKELLSPLCQALFLAVPHPMSAPLCQQDNQELSIIRLSLFAAAEYMLGNNPGNPTEDSVATLACDFGAAITTFSFGREEHNNRVLWLRHHLTRQNTYGIAAGHDDFAIYCCCFVSRRRSTDVNRRPMRQRASTLLHFILPVI